MHQRTMKGKVISRFLKFLYNFIKFSIDRLDRCPVGFSLEIIAVFYMKKKLKLTQTENDKNPKIFNFPKLLRNFRQIFDRREMEFFKGLSKKELVVQLIF